MDPLAHYIRFGINEGRDPNRFFDGAWYREHYADVAATAVDPLVHYLRVGAPELRNPHPHFDAAWYAEQHVEAAGNPLVYHLLFGRARGWPTERPIRIADFLPSKSTPPACPPAWSLMSSFRPIVALRKRGVASTPCSPTPTDRPVGSSW